MDQPHQKRSSVTNDRDGSQSLLPAGWSDAIHPNPEIARRLQHIYTLNRDTINLRLERSPYNVLLERLGNPHLDLPPVLHVAGTNGKGSTIAFLQHILQEAGYHVHVYTSPHLTIFNERITLAGAQITDDVLCEALDRVDQANGDNAVTFFEYTTALAFDVFSRHKDKADILLLEVGMGGRLDCTNIIETPLCTAITKIGFDHMQYLGDAAEKIAAEKAGIIKQGVPCVIGIQDLTAQTQPVFERVALEKSAPLIPAQKADLDYDLGLAGAHQYENAGTALALVSLLKTHHGFDIQPAHIKAGLSHTKWRGRMEHIKSGALYRQLCAMFDPHDNAASRQEVQSEQNAQSSPDHNDGLDLFVDGGHNVSAAYALKQTFEKWKDDEPFRPVYMMLGMGHDKDVNAFLDVVAPHLDGLYLMDVAGGLHPQNATELYEKLTPKHQSCTQIWMNHETQTQIAAGTSSPRIILCGSLFLYALTQQS